MSSRDPFSLGTATVIGETEKALKVQLVNFPGITKWIPKSVVHDDSEVYDDEANDHGELFVQEWFGEQFEDELVAESKKDGR